jgi:molecular chaperone IbpA
MGSKKSIGHGRPALAGDGAASQFEVCAGRLDAQNTTAPRPLGADPRRMSLPLEDMKMRHFDLSPLYRSTVGFDRLFSLLDQSPSAETASAYPPYNIERTGETTYRVTLAVAGFAESDLAIEVRENQLSIRGSRELREEADAQKTEVLYQGIAGRAFERRFQLADHVQVSGAKLENGLLSVDLVREIPEAKKPRQIPIRNGQSAKIVEARQAA